MGIASNEDVMLRDFRHCKKVQLKRKLIWEQLSLEAASCS